MIKFTLKCDADHHFDSWFQSAEAFDTLRRAGHVSCAICGSASVEKALMAPSVRPARKATSGTAPGTAPAPASTPLSHAPTDLQAQALAELRRQVEETSDYVGMNFAREARDMHDGLVPERPIYGEAGTEDAWKLLEDGVPVAPLPFVPGRKTN